MDTELDRMAFMLFYVDQVWDDVAYHYSGEGELHDFPVLFDISLRHWKEHFLTEKDSIHCGDCTNVPCVCMRCVMDEYYRQAQEFMEKMNE